MISYLFLIAITWQSKIISYCQQPQIKSIVFLGVEDSAFYLIKYKNLRQIKILSEN